jgi:hypothetical protein
MVRSARIEATALSTVNSGDIPEDVGPDGQERRRGARLLQLGRAPRPSLRCRAESLAQTNSKTHHVPCKIHCKNCSSPLFDEGRNAVLSFPGPFRMKEDGLPEEFQATDHIFYAQVRSPSLASSGCIDGGIQRSIDFRDGKTKWVGHVGSEKMDE